MKAYLVRGVVGPTETTDMITNPNEPATDAITRTVQEILGLICRAERTAVALGFKTGARLSFMLC